MSALTITQTNECLAGLIWGLLKFINEVGHIARAKPSEPEIIKKTVNILNGQEKVLVTLGSGKTYIKK